MSLQDLEIKNEYRSLSQDIISDFYEPVLQEAVLYQRAVGFFSSSALTIIANGVEGLIKNNGKIQLITSPKLSATDVEEISIGYEVREVLEKALLREINTPQTKHEYEKLSYIARLIAKGILDIRIAFLTNNNNIAMYHEKMGIVIDSSGNAIAFSGSMNESENAFYSNYESFDVFCSWTNDKERVLHKQLTFNAIWGDYELGIETIPFPEAVKEKLYEYKSNLFKKEDKIRTDIDKDKEDVSLYLPDKFIIRDYQSRAIKNWKKQGYRGIFDMATGTGKTLTALAGVEQLFRDNKKRLGIIIVCPYQHLVEQWVEDIENFGIRPIIGYSRSSQRNWKKKLEQAIRSFNLNVLNFFCFITTNASYVTDNIQAQIKLLGKDVVYVVDEAHNMGAEYYRKFLPENIKYRLALSATIDRHKDELGTQSLYSYFGEKCISYPLSEAIESGMLTPYYYYPILTFLDNRELDEYLEITTQLAGAINYKNGKPILTDYAKQLLIKRSRVVAGAKDKINALHKQIEPYVNDKHILVYCGTTTNNDDEDINFGKRQIDIVSDLLGNTLSMRVGRFTSHEDIEERIQIREAFADGTSLQTLVAIKCLDEGVNIPSIKTAFILASSTNPKEYIQRRGRVLRKFNGKEYAEIFDFITLPFNFESAESLNPNIVKSTKGLIKRELIRMLDFANLAENPSITNEYIYELKYHFDISEEELSDQEENDNVI